MNRISRTLLPKAALLSFVAFVVSAFPGCSGPPKKATWSNATGAEQYERLMWQSAASGNWRDFERRLAPAFVGVDASGKSFDRAGWIERWKNAGVHDFAPGEIQVQPAGPEMVLTYELNLGGASSQRLRVVSVWQQVKSGWILIACSMTPITT